MIKKIILIILFIIAYGLIGNMEQVSNKVSSDIDNNNYTQYRIQQSNMQLQNELTSNK